MNQTETFPAMPFPSELETERSMSPLEGEYPIPELEEELRRGSPTRVRTGSGRSRPPIRSAAYQKGPGRPRPTQPRPPVPPRRPPAGRPWAPWGVVREPFPVPGEPEPASGAPEGPGSEYIRWTQDCLNRVMSAGLPVDGVMTPAARSIVRSFQRRENLPVSGIVGPETEDALKRACGGATSSPAGTDAQLDQEWGFEVARGVGSTSAAPGAPAARAAHASST